MVSSALPSFQIRPHNQTYPITIWSLSPLIIAQPQISDPFVFPYFTVDLSFFIHQWHRFKFNSSFNFRASLKERISSVIHEHVDWFCRKHLFFSRPPFYIWILNSQQFSGFISSLFQMEHIYDPTQETRPVCFCRRQQISWTLLPPRHHCSRNPPSTFNVDLLSVYDPAYCERHWLELVIVVSKWRHWFLIELPGYSKSRKSLIIGRRRSLFM